MKIKSFLVLILVVLLSIPLTTGCADKSPANQKETTAETTSNTYSSSSVPELVTTPAENNILFSQNDNVFNILLLGIDDINNLGITDTMILLSIDREHNKIKLTSFMRDTYMNIPGYNMNKLNMAYGYGHEKLAVSTIETNYSIDIHRYMVFNYFTFRDIIDTLGGVTINLTKDEVSQINNLITANGKTEIITEEFGNITLTGTQALWYIRTSNAESTSDTSSIDDFERTEKQREIIASLITQFKDAPATKLMELAPLVLSYIGTDLTVEETQLLLYDLKTYLSYGVEGTDMPADTTWEYTDNQTEKVIFVTDWNKNRELLHNFIYE